MNDPKTTMRLQGATVLELKLAFDPESFDKHWSQRNTINPTKPTLRAGVIRYWFDEKSGRSYPVDTAVANNLTFFVNGFRAEDAHGGRFFVDAVAAEQLEMGMGPVVRTVQEDNGEAFSCDTRGIEQYTPMKLFIDIPAQRGAILYYVNQDGYVVDLALPDDLPFNPYGVLDLAIPESRLHNADKLLIPPAHKQVIKESELFQGSPAPAGDSDPS